MSSLLGRMVSFPSLLGRRPSSLGRTLENQKKAAAEEYFQLEPHGASIRGVVSWGVPITWKFDTAGGFALMSISDPYTMDDWRAAMTAILQAPVRRSHVAMLVDRRGTPPLSTDDIEVMTRFLAEYRTELAGGRAAILVNDDVNFGMGRMTQLRSKLEIPNTTIRAFRSYSEAVTWLTTQDE